MGLSVTDELALIKTNNGCLACSTWDGFASAEASDTSVRVATGKAGRDEVTAEVLEIVASVVEVRVNSTEATVGIEATETSLDAVSTESATNNATTDVELSVKTSCALLLSETTETTEVLVGADITEATKTVVDACTAVESSEAWPVSNVGLDATKAGEALSATEVTEIAEIAPFLAEFTASINATNLTKVVESVRTTSVNASTTEAGADDGSASTTEEATSSVIDDAI